MRRDLAVWTCTSRPCENCSPVARRPSTATYSVCGREPPDTATRYDPNGRSILGPTTDTLQIRKRINELQ